MKKFLLIVITVMLVFAAVGCQKMANSYISFSIDEFDDFFDITDINAKESYIKNWNMEFAKIGNLIVCPFIKETTHEECSLLLYIYTINENTSNATINGVRLSDKNGVVIYEEDSKTNTVELSTVTDEMLSSVTVIGEFDKNENWFYSGNELQLSRQITVEDKNTITEEHLDYTVKLIGHRNHVMPT